MSTSIINQIQQLRSMTVSQLREKYEEVFGEPTTARNKDYLWKKIAWRIQELEYGGLSERAKQRAREINEHMVRMALKTPIWVEQIRLLKTHFI